MDDGQVALVRIAEARIDQVNEIGVQQGGLAGDQTVVQQLVSEWRVRVQRMNGGAIVTLAADSTQLTILTETVHGRVLAVRVGRVAVSTAPVQIRGGAQAVRVQRVDCRRRSIGRVVDAQMLFVRRRTAVITKV